MRYTIIIGAAFLLISGLASCDKYLSVDPDNRAELNSPAAVRELLATAYPQASYIMFSESMSDNFTDKGNFANSQVNVVNRDAYRFIENIQSREKDSPDFYWAACYKAIAAANQALKYIEEAGNTRELQAYKGEALLCRAYAHFMLGIFFARPFEDESSTSNPGIPYIKEVEDVVVKKYDRGTVLSMYDNIQQDIEDGLPLIDDDAYANSEALAYHFNKRAAYAFATRFYIFKKDYTNVIKYAKLCFPNPNVLSASLRDVVSYKILPYYVLQQRYTISSEPTNLLLVTTESDMHNFPFFRYGTSGQFATSFMWKESPIPNTSYAWNLYGQENLYNIPKFRSYEYQSRTYNAQILFSSEEVLFNWAEAEIMTNNYDKALELFSAYLRKKLVNNSAVSMPDLTEGNLYSAFSTTTSSSRREIYTTAVLDFKRREYAFEGMRWLDMLRHRIPVHHPVLESPTDIVVGANDPRRILQIPLEAEMSGVERNPR